MNRKSRVLLVDDEPDTRKRYADLLESAGYEVVVTSSGSEASAKINGWRPDVILLNVLPPGTEGVEVARDLAGCGDTKEIPLVIITALTGIGGSLDGIPGISRLVYKPCRPRTLIEGVEDALRYHH